MQRRKRNVSIRQRESIIEDISFNHIRFELTDSKLNKVAGGNIDLRGAAIKKSLFSRDIPAFLATHVKGLRVNDFQLQWVDTRMPFYTHGIELNNFEDAHISYFKGTGSPINPKAFKIYAERGKGLIIDDKTNVFVKEVK